MNWWIFILNNSADWTHTALFGILVLPLLSYSACLTPFSSSKGRGKNSLFYMVILSYFMLILLITLNSTHYYSMSLMSIDD